MTMKKEKGDDNMTTSVMERHCTIKESIIESFKEVELMRSGKLPKQSWSDYMKEKQQEKK